MKLYVWGSHLVVASSAAEAREILVNNLIDNADPMMLALYQEKLRERYAAMFKNAPKIFELDEARELSLIGG